MQMTSTRTLKKLSRFNPSTLAKKALKINNQMSNQLGNLYQSKNL